MMPAEMCWCKHVVVISGSLSVAVKPSDWGGSADCCLADTISVQQWGLQVKHSHLPISRYLLVEELAGGWGNIGSAG